MRSVSDRIRHAISFELIGLAIITPLGAFAFGMPIADIGVVGVASATVATAWNYLYNLGFDHVMQRLTGGTKKSLAVRILHAVLFEGGLLVALLPLIAWYLGVSLLQAFMMDVSFALFYLVYAFAFNLAYDRIFPLPDWQGKAPDAVRG
ncbi:MULTISPECIES: PACE efflux transporter [unclassified Rhizobium]|uniref:PACE efflux transporter n=1 Tax=unclassified Rhizobium TaxID=2613769 RepID=UPI001ADC5951|nr:MULTISPECIES: PACE efflux transporter [unclassified Rhizobium]MBO9122283.1 PACE efflux transporter [Rhizobium sp. 16-488-2b]MBO9172647.1 PACE efflux transporter [Rhizobium sp. 16-488-2a]